MRGGVARVLTAFFTPMPVFQSIESRADWTIFSFFESVMHATPHHDAISIVPSKPSLKGRMLRTTPEKKHVCTCAHAARVQSLMLLTQRARCFIQQEDCRAAQHRASDVDALLLPS
eukprot:COSAG06_NODE_2389_length_6965_cov_6.611273_10_plen_116_part_00